MTDPIEALLNGNLEDVSSEIDSDVIEESEKDDINENETNTGKIKIEPKKRAIRNPRPRLNIETLTGNRGIHTLENYFHDIKFGGKHKEKNDLNEIMCRLQHWAHRMYPSLALDDVLSTIDRLSKTKHLQMHMSRYRQGLLDEKSTPGNIGGENITDQEEPFDEFDALIGEQIALSKTLNDTTLCDNLSKTNHITSTEPILQNIFAADITNEVLEISSSEPPEKSVNSSTLLTEEQLNLIATNRAKALERLQSKKKKSIN